MPIDLTLVEEFDGWFAKRDDLAAASGPEFPAGSKVRQYAAMAEASPGVPMIVGCSADSAMQIYVAAAAKQAGVPGIIYTAARKQRTDATLYAIEMGARVIELKPGYLSQCRSEAKRGAKLLGRVVRWDVAAALRDAMIQCQNIPHGVKRVVVPTGSGLTCAGVLAGLAERQVEVIAIAVSGMANETTILEQAGKLTGKPLPAFSLIRASGRYGDWKAARLPSGEPLDPFYAAKAVSFVKPGDCLWIPGVRPWKAFPEDCRKELKG